MHRAQSTALAQAPTMSQRTSLAPAAPVYIGMAVPPALPPQALYAWAAAQEDALRPFLDQKQQAHLRRFGREGLALHARVSRITVRLLLCRILKNQGCAAPYLETCAGLPYIEGWRLSISHSGHAAFCALQKSATAAATGRNDRPLLGLDSEFIRAVPPALRAFSPQERAACRHGKDLLRAWTVKEALLKAVGRGLRQDPATVYSGPSSARQGQNTIDGTKLHWRTLALCGHWLSLATTRPAEVHVAPLSAADLLKIWS